MIDFLRDAEAYFLMSQEEHKIPEFLIAPGTYERRMWISLFQWAENGALE